MSTLPTGTAGQAVIDAARNFALTGEGFDAMCRAIEAYETQPAAALPRFPVELRKIWNGGEVQHWIDKNVAPFVKVPEGCTPADAKMLREANHALAAENDGLRAELRRRTELERGVFWYWQGDGEDHLESLTCQVVIRAEDLRAMLADRAALIQALQKALAYWMPKVFDERSAHDAYLLVGYQGEAEESYGEKIKDRADLYDHMLEVAKANGHESITAALAEVKRLNAIINTPHTDDFLKSVSIEAEHQRQRWDDSGKTPADWFWLVGYLAGKALNALISGDQDKAEHHVITTAAALANWHRTMRGAGDVQAIKPEPRTAGEAVFRMGDDGICRIVTAPRAPYEWRDTGALETGEGHA